MYVYAVRARTLPTVCSTHAADSLSMNEHLVYLLTYSHYDARNDYFYYFFRCRFCVPYTLYNTEWPMFSIFFFASSQRTKRVLFTCMFEWIIEVQANASTVTGRDSWQAIPLNHETLNS